MYGTVRLEGEKVLFTHDRHQEAARALIPAVSRSDFLAKIAQKLEKQGPDYVFVVADLLTDALPNGLYDWSPDTVCEICKPGCPFSLENPKLIKSHDEQY